jgi:hypothetical protein
VKEDVISQLGLETSSVSEIICRKKNYYMVLVEDKLHVKILRKKRNPLLYMYEIEKSCIEISSQLQNLGFKPLLPRRISSKEKDKNK